MMRAVLDTTQYVSAFISPSSVAAQIMQYWRNATIELATSPPLLEEIEDVLHRPHIQQRCGVLHLESRIYVIDMK